MSMTKYLAMGVPRGGEQPRNNNPTPGVFIANPSSNKGNGMKNKKGKGKGKGTIGKYGALPAPSFSTSKGKRTQNAPEDEAPEGKEESKKAPIDAAGAMVEQEKTSIMTIGETVRPLTYALGGYVVPSVIAFLLGKDVRKSLASFAGGKSKVEAVNRIRAQAIISGLTFVGGFTFLKGQKVAEYRTSALYGSGIRALRDIINCIAGYEHGSFGMNLRSLFDLPRNAEVPPSMQGWGYRDYPADNAMSGYETWTPVPQLSGYENWTPTVLSGYENWTPTQLAAAPTSQQQVAGYDWKPVQQTGDLSGYESWTPQLLSGPPEPSPIISQQPTRAAVGLGGSGGNPYGNPY
jgi:hypothetical protein